MCTCIYIYIYIHIHIRIYIYMCVCTYVLYITISYIYIYITVCDVDFMVILSSWSPDLNGGMTIPELNGMGDWDRIKRLGLNWDQVGAMDLDWEVESGVGVGFGCKDGWMGIYNGDSWILIIGNPPQNAIMSSNWWYVQMNKSKTYKLNYIHLDMWHGIQHT